MRKVLAIVGLLAVGLLPLRAQWSEIYASPDAEYTEGIALYQQGQFATAQAHLQNYQDDFYYVACAFELRQPLAQKQLKEYLELHPYTPYASEVHYMLGVLRVEAGKYRGARKELSKAVKSELFRQHQDALSFYAGYAHLQMNDLGGAAREFESIKNHGGPYAQMATYYYGYAEYAKGNYAKALPALLSVEKTNKFGAIVPYYIVQMYYQQGQYDEVQSRAQVLLAQDPDKAVNRSELYRIMGEIAYQQQRYDSTIVYLKEYNRLTAEEGSKPVREDLYLLGISQYKMGEAADAIATLKQVRPLMDSLTQSTQLHLGHCYRMQGQKEQAKMAYGAAMRFAGKGSESAVSQKTREEAMYNYALMTYEAGGMPGESVTAFTTFIKEYPQSKHRTEVYSLLSSVFMNSKDYAQALNALNSIEDPTPDMVLTKQFLRYQLGTDAFLNGKYAVASGWFDELISNASLGALRGQKEASTYLREAWFWKAESEYRQGNYDEAAQAVSAFRNHPDAAKSANYTIADYLQAYIYFQKKDYQPAATRFRMFVERADKTQATYADALCRLGDCAFAGRDFVEAEAWYKKAIETGGSGTDYAMFQRGYTMGLLNRHGEKVTEMDALVRQYPKSDYAADALYEIARAELRRNNTDDAIDAYDRLLRDYPNSSLTRKAALEKAMLYYNDRRFDDAIAAYKTVVEKYPNSDEARAALEGIETCYVETNNVAEYLAYTKTLTGATVTASNEDSLTFAAAERLYLMNNDAEAIPALNKYILAWCDAGQHCVLARYYVADAYYRQGQKVEARQAYQKLAELRGNPYEEEAVMRVAEIAYDEQDYQLALRYFQRLEGVASSARNTDIARLGVLRSAYFLGDNATTVQIASTLLSEPSTDAEVQDEARYNRAKAYLALNHVNSAKEDLEVLAEDVRTEHGAEAKYRLAQIAFDEGKLDQAEEQIMAFAGMNTSHQYWLARAFVLLADIYVARGDDFQAQQYLLSLQQNYRVNDDIQTLCADRMDAIVARSIESTKQQQVEEDDDDEDDDE